MSDTSESLRRQISSAGDLQSVVRTMKALAASSIGQYEQSVRALGEYYRTVELGLTACFRQGGQDVAPVESGSSDHAAAIGAIVFGSDQGLVGQFNDVVADYAIDALARLPGQPRIWAVGERVQSRLVDAGMPVVGLFEVPRARSRRSPRWSAAFRSRAKPGAPAGEYAQSRLSRAARKSRRRLRARQSAPPAARCAMAARSGPASLAHQDPAGSLVPGYRHLARPHPRAPLHLPLSGLRRIARQRKRQPPRRHAARREEHQRPAGNAPRHLSSTAPERHRRRAFRRCRWLRGNGEK